MMSAEGTSLTGAWSMSSRSTLRRAQERCADIAHGLEEGGVVLFPQAMPLEQEVFAFCKGVYLPTFAGGRSCAGLEVHCQLP